MSAARHILDGLAAVDPRIWQAVIAGLFVAVGWIVNGRQNRRAAARLRHEQREDVQRALVAEIKHYLEVLESEDFDAVWEAMQPRIAAGYVPFLPTEYNDMVFQSVLENIHILPKSIIDPVVKYYSQLNAIEVQIADSRLKPFVEGTDTASRKRREIAYFEYLQMKQRARTYAVEALRQMGADPVVSNPGSARSDQ
ncbi:MULTISPECIES: hypothetical protein [Roseobacteraceae]|uniref:hypothetical protein n=1 Tax=Roseobacteraceae TaxID=2854170 RepID=UPI001C43EDDD|nr:MULTISPECIES: hypothetical protein [Roseobacteraceae]MBV7408932.1 hypothetical protein [Maritimibacter sp. DP1N21-5]MBY5934381.1 hypothetical protein [Tateyamaria omphalii]